MQYRLLGKTGLRASGIGFGAWQLNNPLWGGPDETESIRLVRAALDAGCNFFDTAPHYGDGASERLLGRALRGRRHEAVVCTKFGHTGLATKDFSVTALRPSLEGSLRRLQTDQVDVLLLHNPPIDRLDGARAPRWCSDCGRWCPPACRWRGRRRASASRTPKSRRSFPG